MLSIIDIEKNAALVPELLKSIKELKQENDMIKELILNSSSKTVLNVEQVADYTGLKDKQTIRRIMNEAGCSKIGRELFVRKSDLDDYLMKNKRRTKDDILLQSNKIMKNRR